MLTLRRFRTMIDSYGADPLRWPDEMRAGALALLDSSAEARAAFREARRLDHAIEAARARDDSMLRHPDEQAAALARVRSGVAARIATSKARRPTDWDVGWMQSLQMRWIGMATSGGLAIAAGLLIGATYASRPEFDTVLSMLQPVPIHILAD